MDLQVTVTDFFLDPQICCGQMSYTSKSATFCDAYGGSCIAMQTHFQVHPKIPAQGLEPQCLCCSIDDSSEFCLTAG